MVLNGFGFVQQRLYLTPEFFERVPTERLIGEGVRLEHLNEGVLGRALDDLFEYGVTELFRDVAAHAAGKLGLGSRFAHLDATSFSFHGEYDSNKDPTDGVIRIQQGYCFGLRPDLNQAVFSTCVERKAGLPVLMKPLSGNANDSGSFSWTRCLNTERLSCRWNARWSFRSSQNRSIGFSSRLWGGKKISRTFSGIDSALALWNCPLPPTRIFRLSENRRENPSRKSWKPSLFRSRRYLATPVQEGTARQSSARQPRKDRNSGRQASAAGLVSRRNV